MTHSMNPTISVIIPCYNRAALVREAIDSALRQTYPPLEIIVVDDASTDDSAAVAESFGPPVRVIRQQCNQQKCAARNRGIAEARGNYFVFLDSDDLLHPEAFRWMLEACGGRDDRMVVTGWRAFHRSPDEPVGEEHLPPQDARPLPALLHRNLGPIHAFLVPATAVRAAGGFALSLLYCEDWDLWLRVAIAGLDLAVVPRVGAYYRITPGSESSYRAEMMYGRVEVLLRAHEQLVRKPELLRQMGTDLCEIEQFMLRRVLAWNSSAELAVRLFEAQRQLERLRFGRPVWHPRRLMDRMFGLRAERYILTMIRLAAPRKFAKWRRFGD